MKKEINDNTLKWVKNKNTPASILEEIAENLEETLSDVPYMFFSDEVIEINVAIIQNPNVSPKTIINLTSKYTRGLTYLVDNPAIDLILLSDPDIIEKIYLKYRKKYSLEQYIEGVGFRLPCFDVPPQFSSLAANSKCIDLRQLVACEKKLQ